MCVCVCVCVCVFAHCQVAAADPAQGAGTSDPWGKAGVLHLLPEPSGE